MMFTSGQAARICATILWISAKLPNAASWLASRKRAHSTCSPQKMYSGR
jgi:hypothetical protein